MLLQIGNGHFACAAPGGKRQYAIFQSCYGYIVPGHSAVRNSAADGVGYTVWEFLSVETYTDDNGGIVSEGLFYRLFKGLAFQTVTRDKAKSIAFPAQEFYNAACRYTYEIKVKFIEKTLAVFGYKLFIIVNCQGFFILLVQQHITGSNHSAAASAYIFPEKALISAVHNSAVFVGDFYIVKPHCAAPFPNIIARLFFCFNCIHICFDTFFLTCLIYLCRMSINRKDCSEL